MPQPFVLPATAGRTDLLAQAHARSTAVGLRAHERPDFAAVAPRCANCSTRITHCSRTPAR